jgi:hypothetical protein
MSDDARSAPDTKAPAPVVSADARMTKGEREDLQRLVHQREKVPTSAAKERSATQAICAEIIGDDTASGAGLMARAHAPVLRLCRQLIAAGHDLTTPLLAYRGATLCLRIHSIGEAAALTVRESTSDGRPRFARLNGDVGPPMRHNGLAATSPAGRGT